MALQKYIMNIVVHYILITTVVTGALAQSSVEDDGGKKSMMLFRLFPALATVAIFIGGVIVVSVKYWKKTKEQRETSAKPLEDKETASSWLEKLRQTQTDGGGASAGRRHTLSFGKKFLANSKVLRMKKYALYEDMLSKYKHQLRMQKIHSMNRLAKSITESQEHETEEPGTGGRKIERGKRAGSGRMRMRDLALRHRLTHEQQDSWQLEAMMQNQMEPVFWMSAATKELSNIKDDDDGTAKIVQGGSGLETQEALKQVSIDIESTSTTTTADQTKETDFQSPEVVSSEALAQESTKTSHENTYQIEIDNQDTEEIKDRNDKGRYNVVSAQVLHDHDDSDEPLLRKEKVEEKDVKEIVKLRPRRDNRKRPKSMFGSLNSKKFAYLPDEDYNGRKKEKRKSWIQGLFSGKEEPKPKKDTRLSMNDIDNFIDDQMEKAFLTYISNEAIGEKDIMDILGVRDEDQSEVPDPVPDVPVNTGNFFERADSMPNVRVQQRSKRPVTWFACTNETKEIKERKLSNRRPKSLSLIERLKERFRAAESSYFDERAITELFAGLMDMQPALTDSQQQLDTHIPSTSLPTLEESRGIGESVHIKSSHVDQVLQEVERRMIQRLNERDEIESNEVEALENLLDDITKFSVEYSGDFQDVEDRRQLTFSQANSELMEVETRVSSRFDESPVSSTSGFSPYLSSEHMPSSSTSHGYQEDLEMSRTDEDERVKRDSIYDTNFEPTTKF